MNDLEVNELEVLKNQVSFLVHTINSSIAGISSELNRRTTHLKELTVGEEKSFKYDIMELYRISSRLPYVSSVVSLFQMMVAEKEKMIEKWSNDIGKSSSLSLVLYSVLVHTIQNMLYEQGLVTLRKVRKEGSDFDDLRDGFIEITQLENTECFFDWVKQNLKISLDISNFKNIEFTDKGIKSILLSSVLIELIKNGLEYCNEDGIEISIKNKNNKTIIEIRNKVNTEKSVRFSTNMGVSNIKQIISMFDNDLLFEEETKNGDYISKLILKD